jgi:predicted amidohydrolase
VTSAQTSPPPATPSARTPRRHTEYRCSGTRTTRARALENRIPHLYVNRCGAERGLEFAGRTRAIDADGVVTAEAGPLDEELILAEVGPPGTTDDRLDYLAQRRGELPVDLGVRSTEAS